MQRVARWDWEAGFALHQVGWSPTPTDRGCISDRNVDTAEQLLGTAGFAEAVSTTVDLAILPRLGTRSTQLRMAATLPRVGERVVVIGAPEGLTNTVSDGLVSAIRTIDGRTLLQISAPISPGSSGGPVLNEKGEVMGVSVSILREGQNLNFAVPLADYWRWLGAPLADWHSHRSLACWRAG